MNYWLVKSEPSEYSYDDLVKDGSTYWDGVRNYAARNNLKSMQMGDLVLYYHSVNEKAVIGICEVVREHYPDPTTSDERWVVVDFVPVRKLDNPVTLDMIKRNPNLSEMVLVQNSRLSVQPVKAEEFDIIIGMGSK